ncbi:MAG TPA: RsmE family RNA methyltransferase, partial [Pirellulaceae bacterium]|nr:RsmE family RNA methyltransferase [Pirellulaceae bacterium]
MALPRFFIASLPQQGTVVLEAEEARHASNVLRVRAGDSVVVFDGQGGEALAKVICADRREVELELDHRTDTNRELPLRIEMIVALPKGDRQKTLVEGLVQLGVQHLIPLATERSVAQPSKSTIAKLERLVVECSKQCGRNQLMTIGQPYLLSELMDRQPLNARDNVHRLFAHPYGDAVPLSSLLNDMRSRPTQAIIGPEGGFTEGECHALASGGFLQVSLGPGILR